MTIETYHELFYYITFPVFAVRRDTDKIIYKNLACEKYLPKLSKKNSLNSFIFGQNFKGIGAVKLAESDLYHTAIALEDGENSVFLFPSHLQYEEGVYRASQVFHQFGPSLTDFLAALHIHNSFRTTGSVLPGTNRDLYTKMSRIMLDEKDLEFRTHAAFYPVMSNLFAKLNTAFSASNYRVKAEIQEDFPTYLHPEIATKDILFVLGRLLYLQMKLSKNRNVNLLLYCDIAYSQHVFYLTAKTNLSGLSEKPDELITWLLDFIPECKMEFSLLYKVGLLTNENFVAKIDRFGNLYIRYNVPYRSPETYYVRSVETQDIFFLQAVDTMLESLLAKLTDNGASC